MNLVLNSTDTRCSTRLLSTDRAMRFDGLLVASAAPAAPTAQATPVPYAFYLVATTFMGVAAIKYNYKMGAFPACATDNFFDF